MRDAGIGRLLVAALHQGIADALPDRLEFYEAWLNPRGLRDGTIGLAPLNAVLSFLRTEGEAVYTAVSSRAGVYAGDWTIDELPPWRRRAIEALPAALKRRAAIRVARSLIGRAYSGSRARSRFRRGVGQLDVRGSIFCGVRTPTAYPLCRFYASAVAQVFARLDIEAEATVIKCQATGEPFCHVQILMGSSLDARRAALPPHGEPAA